MNKSQKPHRNGARLVGLKPQLYYLCPAAGLRLGSGAVSYGKQDGAHRAPGAVAHRSYSGHISRFDQTTHVRFLFFPAIAEPSTSSVHKYQLVFATGKAVTVVGCLDITVSASRAGRFLMSVPFSLILKQLRLLSYICRW